MFLAWLHLCTLPSSPWNITHRPRHNKFYFISVRNLHRKRKLNATPPNAEGGRAREEKKRGRKSSWKIRRVKKRRDTLDLRVARDVDFVSPPDRVICATFRNVPFHRGVQGPAITNKDTRESRFIFSHVDYILIASLKYSRRQYQKYSLTEILSNSF